MNAYRRLKEIEAEMEALCNAPKTAETEDRYWDLEEEKKSLIWELDARIW
jgi:hypothetical protein